MKKITAVQALPGQKLEIRFNDGVAGVVDLSADAGRGIFAPWKDPEFFAAVKLGHGGRSLDWPGEIDLCADALYLEITGKKAEHLFPNWVAETTQV
jgi:hypothetical protein